MRIGAGSEVKIELGIFNPYSIELPIVLCSSTLENCQNEETFLKLRRKLTTAKISIIPLVQGTCEISEIQGVIYQGRQHLRLPKPLEIDVVSGVAEFSIRTDMPVGQTLKLFDGELYSFTVWLVNTGKLPITDCQLRFNMPAKIPPIRMPIRASNAIPVKIEIAVHLNMKEIALTAICKTSNEGIQSEVKMMQPVVVKSAITISSIEPVLSLAEIATAQSELLFLAIGLSNEASVAFHYVASFKQSAGGLSDLPCVLTEEPFRALVPPFGSFVFIVAIEKVKLLENTETLPANRVMAFVKAAEEELHHKVDRVTRAELVKRLAVTTFIEQNLTFDWTMANGRRGRLTMESTLPTPNTLTELALHRPRMTYTFGRAVKCHQKMELKLSYHDADVQKCALDLGKYADPEYGVAWNGKLNGVAKKANEFMFVLFFVKPGKFEFRADYVTI
jgi:hypothetical protein